MELSLRKSSILFAVMSVLVLLLSLPQGATALSDHVVDKVCNKTIYVANCTELFRSDPRTKSAKNLLDLAKISVDLGRSNAYSSLNVIKGIAANGTHWNSRERGALKLCVDYFGDAVMCYKMALKELKSNNTILGANYDALMAGDNANYCNNVLVSRKVEFPLISEKISEVMIFSNMGYTITAELG